MRALLVHINGQKHCLAGVRNGGVELSIGLTEPPEESSYAIAMYGVDLETEQVSLWPSASLKVGDEIKIVLVDVDNADPPERLQHGREGRRKI